MVADAINMNYALKVEVHAGGSTSTSRKCLTVRFMNYIAGTEKSGTLVRLSIIFPIGYAAEDHCSNGDADV